MYRDPVKKFILPSKTKQSFKQECDVNHIVKRFRDVNGQDLTKFAGFPPNARFADVSAVPDYRTVRDHINAAEASFMRLPSQLRKLFDNDAASFLDFAADPQNEGQMISWGLVEPKPVVEAVKPVVDVAVKTA